MNDLIEIIEALKEHGVSFNIEGKNQFEKEENIVRAIASMHGVTFTNSLPPLKVAIASIRKNGIVSAAIGVSEEKTKQILSEAMDLCDALGIKDNASIT